MQCAEKSKKKKKKKKKKNKPHYSAAKYIMWAF